MGNREEIPAEYDWNTEGASLEIRRSQAKLSGKRTLFLPPLESPYRTPTVQILVGQFGSSVVDNMQLQSYQTMSLK